MAPISCHTQKSIPYEDLNMKHNYKLSEENRAKNSHDFGTWRDFLSVTKVQTVRERMIHPTRVKLRMASKDAIKHSEKTNHKPGGHFCDTYNQK